MFAKIREADFERLGNLTYLDSAGTSLYPQSLITVVTADLVASTLGNPHSAGGASQATLERVEEARATTLKLFNASPDDYAVVFTSGATAAIKMVGECFPWSSESKFVYLQGSHNSLVGVREYALEHGAAFHTISRAEVRALGLTDGLVQEKRIKTAGYSLLGITAECNFSGEKIDLEFVRRIQESMHFERSSARQRLFVLLDASKLVATSSLDLSKYPADFVVLSYYKIFGYPSGLGALVLRRELATRLLCRHKVYFGGGTVNIAHSKSNFHVPKPETAVEARLEDGTVPFLAIAALRHGFCFLQQLGGMSAVQAHTFALASRCASELRALRHCARENRVCVIYGWKPGATATTQGPVVTFSVLDNEGTYVGFSLVERVLALHHVQVRGGCFCNPGACQEHLGLAQADLEAAIAAGHVCGDNKDLILGRPTGAVRLSFGYFNTEQDVSDLVDIVRRHFVCSGVSNRVPLDSSRSRRRDNEGPSSIGNHSDAPMANSMVASSSSNSLNEDSGDDSAFVDAWDERGDIVKRVPQEDTPGESLSFSSTGQGRVAEIWLYPIKSCAGMRVSSWPLSRHTHSGAIGGLLLDRAFVLVDPNTRTLLDQKRCPRLCLIRPSLCWQKQSVEVGIFDSKHCRSVSVFILFGRPGSGKSTVAATAINSLSNCFGVDLDICVFRNTCTNFEQGIHRSPTLEQRLVFAQKACDFLAARIREGCSAGHTICIVTFSFVDTSTRNSFRSRFPAARWILMDTHEIVASQRLAARKKKCSKAWVLTQNLDRGKTQSRGPEWGFAPVLFEHTRLDGLVAVDVNAAVVAALVKHPPQSRFAFRLNDTLGSDSARICLCLEISGADMGTNLVSSQPLRIPLFSQSRDTNADEAKTSILRVDQSLCMTLCVCGTKRPALLVPDTECRITNWLASVLRRPALLAFSRNSAVGNLTKHAARNAECGSCGSNVDASKGHCRRGQLASRRVFPTPTFVPGFANEGSILLMRRQSLALLQNRIIGQQMSPTAVFDYGCITAEKTVFYPRLQMARFRANVIVDGGRGGGAR